MEVAERSRLVPQPPAKEAIAISPLAVLTADTGISVVIPALNEEDAIAGTVEQLRAVLGDDACEILVVDDGSTDSTAARARQAGATVVSHPHRVGYGRALKTGIATALYDTIVIIDADLTYPCDAIPMLLAEYHKGFDLVVGSRRGHQYHGGVFKGPLRKILRFLVEYCADRQIPDANSGLRIFSRSTVLKYTDHLCDRFSFTTSQTLGYCMTGRFVGFFPIDYHERIGKTKVKLFWDSLATIQYIIQAIIYYNPFKIFMLFAILGVFACGLSFAIGAITEIRAPYLLGIGGLLLSVFVFFLGLIADQLRQILNR